MFIENHKRYYILEEYWHLWGIVEPEDAYICHDVLPEYAKEWNMTVDDLLLQMVEV